MKVTSCSEKTYAIPAEVFALLDPYHKSLAEILQERGLVRILTTQGVKA